MYIPDVYEALITDNDFEFIFLMKIGWSARGIEMREPLCMPTNWKWHFQLELNYMRVMYVRRKCSPANPAYYFYYFINEMEFSCPQKTYFILLARTICSFGERSTRNVTSCREMTSLSILYASAKGKTMVEWLVLLFLDSSWKFTIWKKWWPVLITIKYSLIISSLYAQALVERWWELKLKLYLPQREPERGCSAWPLRQLKCDLD